MFDVEETPWPRFRLPMLESVKVGITTFKERVVVAFTVPAVPVIVTLYCPGTAESLVTKLSVLLPVVGFVPHDAVTPVGSVEVTARVTLFLNPPA